MKKLNNKAFVLVETLVVSVFVLLIFVLIFRNGVPMLEEYVKVANYDDIDSLYTANLIRNTIRKDINSSDILDEMKKAQHLVDLTDCTKLVDINLCRTIKLRTNITEDDKIILTKSNPNVMKEYINNVKNKNKTNPSSLTNLEKYFVNNRRFESYIDHLINTYDSSLVKNKYMLIVTRTIENKNPYLEGNSEAFKDVKTVKFGTIEMG